MKNFTVKLITLGVAVGLSPWLAGAQTGPGHKTRTSGRQLSDSSEQSGQEVRASKLIGANLQTAQGEDLGEIRDLAVNPKTGKIDFAIVGVSDGSGTEALAPIPWQAVQLHSEKSFVASIDKNKLKSAPTISQQQWDQLMQPDYIVQIYRFYGVEPQASGGTGEGLGGAGAGSQQQDQQGSSGSSQ